MANQWQGSEESQPSLTENAIQQQHKNNCPQICLLFWCGLSLVCCLCSLYMYLLLSLLSSISLPPLSTSTLFFPSFTLFSLSLFLSLSLSLSHHCCLRRKLPREWYESFEEQSYSCTCVCDFLGSDQSLHDAHAHRTRHFIHRPSPTNFERKQKKGNTKKERKAKRMEKRC